VGDEGDRMRLISPQLQVRTVRVATGAHFVSFVPGPGSSWPSLEEELGRLPVIGDLVINADGLDEDGALTVGAVLRESGRLEDSGGRIILVCEDASVRRLFELLGLDRSILIEHSLDDSFRDVVGRAWLGEGASPVAPGKDHRATSAVFSRGPSAPKAVEADD
jgi:anti-anti-sigma regulatory factor